MMKELSMHILDIARNSVRAKAKNIKIIIDEAIYKNQIIIKIFDDGMGIEEKLLDEIKNPFSTTRTMRKVGLGIPFLNDTCMLCNGKLNIYSTKGKGTEVIATMQHNHIDRPPMGNIASTIAGLMTSEPDINICFQYYYNDYHFEIRTNEIKDILGEEVSITNNKVHQWIIEHIKTNIINSSYDTRKRLHRIQEY